MGYLDNKTITVDAILTKKGRELLARNDGSFRVTQFALADDEIDYSLFNENHPNGSQFSAEAIENMPLIEAIPDETNIMLHKLVTLNRGQTKLPIINLGISKITLTLGGNATLSPQTFNFGNTSQGQTEPSGYRLIVADQRLLQDTTGLGAAGNGAQNQALTTYSATATSATVIGSEFSMTAISSTSLFGANNALLTTLTVEGRDSGARTTIPLEITKVVAPVTTTATAATGIQTR